jgi:hypothetical protein
MAIYLTSMWLNLHRAYMAIPPRPVMQLGMGFVDWRVSMAIPGVCVAFAISLSLSHVQAHSQGGECSDRQ